MNTQRGDYLAPRLPKLLKTDLNLTIYTGSDPFLNLLDWTLKKFEYPKSRSAPPCCNNKGPLQQIQMH